MGATARLARRARLLLVLVDGPFFFRGDRLDLPAINQSVVEHFDAVRNVGVDRIDEQSAEPRDDAESVGHEKILRLRYSRPEIIQIRAFPKLSHHRESAPIAYSTQGGLDVAMDEINIGSVVELRSGGPIMTVGHIFENDGGSFATCNWFDTNNRPHAETYPIESLRLVPENDVRLGG